MIPESMEPRVLVYKDGERINGADTDIEVVRVLYDHVVEVHIRSRAKTLEQAWFGLHRIEAEPRLEQLWHQRTLVPQRRWYIHVAARDHNGELVHLSPGVAAS